MADFYKPYPNEIYRINDLIPFELEIEGRNHIFLDTIDFRNRCINYNVIIPERRRFEESNKLHSIDKNILKFIKCKWTDFENFIRDHFKPDHEKYIKIFNNFIGKNVLGDEEKIELHYYLVELYNKFPVRSDRYLDGILMKVESQLATKDKSDNRFKAAFIQVEENLKWAWMKFCDVNNNFMEIKTDKSSDDYKIHANQETLNILDSNTLVDPSEKPSANNRQSSKRFFDDYLFHLFYSPIFEAEDYIKRGEWQALPHYFVVVPIFDAGVGDKDYGTVLGHIYVPFDKPFENGEEWEKAVTDNKKLVNSLWNTWAPLAAQAILHGREHELLALPIRYGSDILKDFLSKITYLQDWEKVMVFRTKEDKIPQYCFKRYPGNKKGGLEYAKLWDICEPSPNEDCRECLKSFQICQPASRGCECNGRYYYKYDLSHITDPKVLPSIDNQDIIRYKENFLCFEFPEHTFFPGKNEENIVRLGDHYFQKLVSIFDQLLLKRNVLRHSTQSAVSAIISRNHSHHIGSHVTPRATVEKIRERLGELEYVLSPDNALKCLNILKSPLEEYIQKKADFMAEIATEPLITTVTKAFFGKVLLPFIQTSLLMDNIGANEGVRYEVKNGKDENRLKIHFCFNGQEFKVLFGGGERCKQDCEKYSNLTFPYGGFCKKCGPENILQLVEKLDGQDVEVALPGALGEYAIYCFLENFIRNSVKHNYEFLQDGRDLNIYINVFELGEDNPEKNDFYGIEIWDNVTDPCLLVPVSINGKTEKITLRESLTALIQEPIVDVEGRLRGGGWGVAEMKIMAALLSGSNNFISMGEKLEVTCCRKNGVERLIYRFRLMKPRETAVVTSQMPTDDIIAAHKKHGVWWFKSVKDYADNLTWGRSPATFNFVVLGKNENGINYDEYLHLFPFRVLFLDTTESPDDKIPGSGKIARTQFDQWSCPNNAKKIINDCWQSWLSFLKEKNAPDKPVRLNLYLQQNSKESPTDKWIPIANSFKPDSGQPLNFSVITREDQNPIRPEVQNDEMHLIYDRHFQGSWELCKKFGKVDKLKKILVFHEAFDKTSPDFVPIFAGDPDPLMVYKLGEASLLRLLIIDERVAEAVKDDILKGDQGYAISVYGSSQRLQVCKFAGVFIATHLKINNKKIVPIHTSVQDKPPRVCVKYRTKESGGLKSFQAYWCEAEDCTKCDCNKVEELKVNALIIHQGFIESFLKDVINPGGKEDFVNALYRFFKRLRTEIPYIAIDSGRGIPPNLPKKMKFLPFSLVEDYLMKDRIGKFSLVQIFMSLIRRNQQ